MCWKQPRITGKQEADLCRSEQKYTPHFKAAVGVSPSLSLISVSVHPGARPNSTKSLGALHVHIITYRFLCIRFQADRRKQVESLLFHRRRRISLNHISCTSLRFFHHQRLDFSQVLPERTRDIFQSCEKCSTSLASSCSKEKKRCSPSASCIKLVTVQGRPAEKRAVLASGR
jgi:hypothetical protein